MLSVHILLLLQFLIVWKSPLPIFHSSIAVAKGSPYGLFMRNVIHRITEKGQLQRITSRYRVKTQECKSGLATGNPLGLKKICFPLFVALFGFLLSGLICVCEKIFWTPKLILNGQNRINNSKDKLQRDIGHLKTVLRHENALEWDWLDDTLVKIQDSQVHYNQL
jgi:hypothetical protein